jgi:non-specific serine/threonine protein kinase
MTGPTTPAQPAEPASALPASPAECLRHRFADVEFDEIEGQLRVAGQPVPVEPRPLRLLAELLRRVNEVVTKEELLDAVWDGRPTVDHVLANAVSKLRSALGEQAAARLVTVPRIGYRLAGPVQRLAARRTDQGLAAGQAVPGREAFVLERALGEGGRTDVWLARHAKLGQAHVFKFAEDGARLAALKREYTLYRVLKQELGARDDFAQVIDSNFLAAPYFLECAFGGQSLLEWAQQEQRLAGLPGAERLALFMQIARAVAAAHSVGVLHKDIKPGNVLVQPGAAGTWQLRLTDFGSGRLLDAARLDALALTATGVTQGHDALPDSRSGTAIYMAPELQAGHAATVQSDVYALGVLLYQMWVGDLRRPLATGWQREVEDPLLRDDVAAATEGRPDDRIKSAAELLERLQTLEERRRADAQRAVAEQQALEVAAQWQRSRARRPWVVAAFASLVAGMVLSIAFGVQASMARSRAQAQSQRADAVRDFLNEDLLSGLDVGAVGKDGTVSLRGVLERASGRAAERFGAQPQIESEVRGQLGGLFHVLSMFDSAETEYRRAVELAEKTQPRSDPQLLKLRFELIGTLAVHNKLPEARRLLEFAQRDAAAQTEAATPLALSAARAQARVLHSSGNFAQALPVIERIVALADQGVDRSRPDEWFTSRLFLGDTLFRLGEHGRAETVLGTALAPDAAGRQVGAVRMARARVLQARVWAALSQPDKAEPALMAARDALLGLVGPDEHYVNVANSELAALYDARGDFERARSAFQAVQDAFSRAVGPAHPSTRGMELNVAIAELNLGQTASALARLDAARPWWVQYMGGDRDPVVQAMDFERARALTSTGRAGEASRILQGLDPKALAAASPARDWLWRLQAERGRALMATGQREKGLDLLQAALQPMQENGSPAWVLAGYRKAAGGGPRQPVVP